LGPIKDPEIGVASNKPCRLMRKTAPCETRIVIFGDYNLKKDRTHVKIRNLRRASFLKTSKNESKGVIVELMHFKIININKKDALRQFSRWLKLAPYVYLLYICKHVFIIIK
jgi:hypothetical protein